jgi:hypothetical protein
MIPITGIGCCARAANGHTAADPAIPVMKLRRRIAYPSGLQFRPSEQEIPTSEMGFQGHVAVRNS